MYKIEVSSFSIGINQVFVSYKRSNITMKKRLHPLQSNIKVFNPISEVDGIRIGDIVRNDTLPFMKRPKPICKKDKSGQIVFDKNKKIIKLYKPFRLKSGYWVLRKVV